MKTPTITQLRGGPPSVDLLTAAAVLGLGRTKAYELARRGEFPVRILRIGGSYRVPTAALLELLGISETTPRRLRHARHSPPLPGPINQNGHAMHSPLRLNGAWADARATAWPETVPASRALIIWGAHGGAGASTLATLLKPARDMGALRTEADYRYPVPNPDANPVLVTCRCTTWSAIKASAAATALTRGGEQVSVLAVVSDGWPEPPQAEAADRATPGESGILPQDVHDRRKVEG